MTTEAQVNANRANAEKSTGPRTPEGKAVVAQNAVRHGFWSQEVVIKGEDHEEFALFREGLLEELAPAGLMELILAERIVSLSWRLRRAERLQITAFEKVDRKDEPQPVLKPEDASWLLKQIVDRGISLACPNPEGPKFGRKAMKDFNQERVLDRLLMYERRIEHSLYRTMAELRKLRKEHSEGSPLRHRDHRDDPEQMTETPLASSPCTPSLCGEDSRETKPIFAGDHEDGAPDAETTEEVGRGRPTLDPVEGRLHEESTCGTKPIWEEVSSLKCEVSSEQSQAASPPSLPTANFPLETAVKPPDETKPIAPRRIKDNEGYRPYYRRRR